jgi:hypothetical protein
MTYPRVGTVQNNDQGPITRRRSYWPTSVGTDLDLTWTGNYPREIRVHVGGDLAVTYADGQSEIIKSIPSCAVFVDSCWASIAATGSTAFALTVGW